MRREARRDLKSSPVREPLKYRALDDTVLACHSSPDHPSRMSAPRQNVGAGRLRPRPPSPASSASGAPSRCSSAPRSARGSSARPPASPTSCPGRCRSWPCGSRAGCSRCAARSRWPSCRARIRRRAGCTCSSARRGDALTAFLFGWAELVIIRAASLGAISTTFAEYLLRVLGYDPRLAPYSDWVHYVAAVAIVLTATFNYVGVSWSSLVLNLTTLAKYGGLLFIILLAFAIGLPQTGGHFTPAAPAGSFARGGVRPRARVGALGVRRLGRPVVRRRRGQGPAAQPAARASSSASLAVIAIYLLANLAYLAVMPVERDPHVEARRRRRRAAAHRARPGVVFVADHRDALDVRHAERDAAHRAAHLLRHGRRRPVLPPRRERASEVRDAVCARSCSRRCSASLFVLLRTFEQLADAFVTAIVPFYALGRRRDLRAAPACRLRSAVPHAAAIRVVPALFILATLFLLGNAIIDPTSRWATLAVLGIIVAGDPGVLPHRRTRGTSARVAQNDVRTRAPTRSRSRCSAARAC